MIFTVDEVSVELGIPRPTVYRYLKEYSIPFSRRSGRIFVPEESVGMVRRVRELHEGGLGVEAIRNRLREGDETELSRVTERLDRLTEALESTRIEARRSIEPVYPSPDAHALRLVLARQSLLISAITNLAEMMGDLMAVNGLPRRAVLDFPEGAQGRVPPRFAKNHVIPAGHGAPAGAANGTVVRGPAALPSGVPRDKFGTLARRRRAALAVSALVLLAVLVWQFL